MQKVRELRAKPDRLAVMKEQVVKVLSEEHLTALLTFTLGCKRMAQLFSWTIIFDIRLLWTLSAIRETMDYWRTIGRTSMCVSYSAYHNKDWSILAITTEEIDLHAKKLRSDVHLRMLVTGNVHKDVCFLSAGLNGTSRPFSGSTQNCRYSWGRPPSYHFVPDAIERTSLDSSSRYAVSSSA